LGGEEEMKEGDGNSKIALSSPPFKISLKTISGLKERAP
jgi:hypothetical protein